MKDKFNGFCSLGKRGGFRPSQIRCPDGRGVVQDQFPRTAGGTQIAWRKALPSCFGCQLLPLGNGDG